MFFRITSKTFCVEPATGQELSLEILKVASAASELLDLDLLPCNPPFGAASYISPSNVDFVFNNDNGDMTIVIPAFDRNGNHFLDALVGQFEDPIENGILIPAPAYGLPHGEA